jgi:nucleoside-diphosphate-sugar epimerase
MRILLIGGNGFIGRFAVAALAQQEHALAVFHRGTTATPAGVDEIRGDRHQLNASAKELKRFAPDVVIDLVASSGPQAEELMNIFRGATGRVVMLSSIDVYRAIAVSQGTESGPLQEVPLTEDSELRHTLHPYPPEGMQIMRQIFPWVTDNYDKIPAERTVMNDKNLPGTVLRLPMVWTRGSAASFLSRGEAYRGRTPAYYFSRGLGGLALAAGLRGERGRSHRACCH